MKCPACRGRMEESSTSLPYELGRDKLIVVRDVPALVCAQCGEVFIKSPILEEGGSIVKYSGKEWHDSGLSGISGGCLSWFLISSE